MIVLIFVYAFIQSIVSTTEIVTEPNPLGGSGMGMTSITKSPIPDLQPIIQKYIFSDFGIFMLFIIVILSIPYVFSKIKNFRKDDNEYTGIEVAISLFSLCFTILQFFMITGMFLFLCVLVSFYIDMR